MGGIMELVVISKDGLRDLIVECLSLLQPVEVEAIHEQQDEQPPRDVQYLAERFEVARKCRSTASPFTAGECLSCRGLFHEGVAMVKVYDQGDWQSVKHGMTNKVIGYIHKHVCPLVP